MNNCKDVHQVLTFVGVNYHHKNGRADRRIRSLQDLACYQMIHSHHQWPSEITANLRTYKILITAAIIKESTCHCLN